MLQVVILGSGSSGNCALVCTGKTRLLIDAGLSASQIVSRLKAISVEMDSISGVLLTHEHGDHARGLAVLTRRHSLPILCNQLTKAVLRDSLPEAKHWNLIPNGSSFEFAGLGIDTFSVPHDAADPMGFVLRHGDSALGILTDAGHSTPLMRQRLRDLDTLFIEANYDTNLLANDTKRPWSTKQRISGRHGHLSNEQTATLVAELATARLERVILGHLSRDCNTPDLAAAAVRAELVKHSRQDVEVLCACPRETSPWHRVRSRVPQPAPVPPASMTVTISAAQGPAAAPVSALGMPSVWHQMELL